MPTPTRDPVPLRPWLSGLSGLCALCLPLVAAASPLLGPSLLSYSVLGATTVTNVSPSVIGGHVGVWQSGGANAITGFNAAPGVAVSDSQVGGLVHAGTTSGTPNALQAQAELTTARHQLSSLGPGTVLQLADLVGLTLMPGVYTVQAGSTNLSGLLRLDGGGNANAAWVFQMESTLITSANAVVDVFNTGAGAGLYWNVASSATIDSATVFMGNVLALASVSMNTGATDVCGRVLADTGAVTLQMNRVGGRCDGSLAGSDGLSGGFTLDGGQLSLLPFAEVDGDTGTVPEPGSLALGGLALAAVLGVRRRAGVR